MPLLTLASARAALWNAASNKVYATATSDEKLAVDTAINLACERFITSGKWRGLTARVQFTVYDNQITLPHSLDTVLGCRPIYVTDDREECCPGGSMSIYSPWYQFASGSPTLSECCNPGLLDYGDGFALFRDPADPFYIRVVARSTGESGTVTLNFRGLDEDGSFVQETLTISGLVPTTGAVEFDSVGAWTKSDTTSGVVDIYAVDVATAAATLIATIYPGELTYGYRRYGIPSATTENTDVVEVIAKRAYFPAVADNDPVVPAHLGALKLGMMSLRFEDTNDLERAAQYMERAIDLLDQDRQEFDGDSAISPVQFTDGFGAGTIPTIL